MIDLRNEVVDILAKMKFFQGQRAGRELWNDKPFEVQEQDLESFNKGIKTIRKYISQLEEQPKVNEWIPVEDRLPEDGEDVLVWFEYFRYGSYNRLFQTHGLSYAYDGKWSGFVNGQSGWHQLSIIAWMPLPAPYDMRKKVEE